MTFIHISAGTTAFPLGSRVFLAFSLGNHYQYVRIDLEQFEEHFKKSNWVSVACCRGAPELPQHDLDILHNASLGNGKWLKYKYVGEAS